jgi:S-adenosylmethionine synthetase
MTLEATQSKPDSRTKPATRHSFLFTSESVTEGHPDKVADQISDAILDAILKDDPTGRVAAETLVTTGLALVSGEITTKTYVDIPRVVRGTIRDIGYDDPHFGFDWENCAVLTAIDEQSKDIAMGVDRRGAGDQGLMFGYAVRETPELMPAPIQLAHRLTKALADARRSGKFPEIRPDGKSQVTVEYEADVPKRIDTVVLSTQHVDMSDADMKRFRERLIQDVIMPVLPKSLLHGDPIFHINPTGRFVVGGPRADTGLTGRKIIVDSYGARRRTEAGRSAARIRRRWTAPPATRRGTSPRTSWARAWPTAARSRSPTRSASRSRSRSWSTRTARGRCPTAGSPSSCASTSICVRTPSSSRSI